MDINSLITDVSAAISQSDEISTWALTTYSQTHAVYVGVDMRDLPGEDSCPYVIVYPSDKEVGQAVTHKTHTLQIVCCIYDATYVVHTETNITEYNGVQRIEDLRKKVETVIAAVDVGNALFEDITIEYDTIESFPYMLSHMAITIGEDYTMGSDILL